MVEVEAGVEPEPDIEQDILREAEELGRWVPRRR